MNQDNLTESMTKILSPMTARSCLEEISNHPKVKAFAKNRVLDGDQSGLVATVVSLMQEKVHTAQERIIGLQADFQKHLAKVHEKAQQRLAEESRDSKKLQALTLGVRMSEAAQGIKQLYSIEMFPKQRGLLAPVSPTSTVGAANPDGEKEKEGFHIRSLLTWGHFLTFSALVIAGIAVFYTQAYSNYKDRVASQAEQIKDLRETSIEYRRMLHDREQSLAQARAEAIASVKKKGEADRDAERSRMLAEKVWPLLQVLTNKSGDDLANKLTLAINKLDSEATKLAMKKIELLEANFYKKEYEKELEERKTMQTSIDQLLAEKAKLPVASTNK